MSGNLRQADVLVLASGKGGVGTTNLSLNLAILFSRLELSTLLFDASGQAGAMESLFAREIVPPADASGARAPGGDGVEVRSGPLGLRVARLAKDPVVAGGLSDALPAHYLRALGRLQRECELLLIDCGSRRTPALTSIVLLANLLALVTTPEPTSLTEVYGMFKLACQCGFSGRAAVLVNQARRQSDAVLASQRLQRVAHKFLGRTLEDLGHVPEDRHVPLAVLQCQPFITRYPHTAASVALEGLARRLMQRGERANPAPGLWTRVAGLFF
jgi:flagellar biosynthesis protein FlhG